MAKKSKVEKAIDKQRKLHPVAFLIVVIFLVVGAVAGFFTTKYITRNDKFEIVGEQTITLNIGEVYQENGAVAVSFGKDISSKIKVEDNIDNSKEGRYYVKYTVENIRYKDVVKYRYVVYVGGESNE